MKRKIIGLVLCSLFVSTFVFAVDLSSVNDESVKLVIEIIPKYDKIGAKYVADYGVPAPDTLLTGHPEFVKEIEELLRSYNITITEYVLLFKKIANGKIMLDMLKQSPELADNPEFKERVALFQKQYGIGDEELGVIKRYSKQIEDAFIAGNAYIAAELEKATSGKGMFRITTKLEGLKDDPKSQELQESKGSLIKDKIAKPTFTSSEILPGHE